ncbi:MAG: PmoA family protein, partial [Flavobacteriaceae bacterium]
MLKKIVFCILFSQLALVSCKDKTANPDNPEVATETLMPISKISFTHDTIAKNVSIKINGDLFTNYLYDGQTPKPILYPIITKSGKTVTRGFPYEPRANERVDHPHHAGHWMNYGDVNGLDFWNNSYAIPTTEKDKYGTIIHQKVTKLDPDNGILSIKAVWQAPNGTNLLEEATTFTFSEDGDSRVIDRSTTLTALEKVTFKDNKEGMFAIRV